MKTTALKRPALHRIALLALPLAIGAIAINSGPSHAALSEQQPTSSFERVQFADVIEAAQPAVVQIAVVKNVADFEHRGRTQAGPGQGAFEEFMRRFSRQPFGQFQQRGPKQQAEGLGSGFIIDSDGHIVTNHHVISNAAEINVTLHDGRELEAKLVGIDSQTDLALLKVEGGNLPSIQFGDSDKTRVGDWVVAIGSPFGFGGSVTAGIVSARGRDIKSGPYDDYLQIDAPINSGNSGGPIIDARGHVVGVNTAIFSPNGGNIGIGFAIPAADAARVVHQLRDNGTVTRGRLGVQIQAIDSAMASALGIDHGEGALVAEVVPDSAAQRAGVRAGDVVTRFAGTSIGEPRDLSKAVSRSEPGSKTTLTVLRAGKEKELTAIIGRYAETPLAQQDQRSSATDDALGLGLALGSISAQTRSEMSLSADTQGALVLGIKSGGIAESGGLQPGDIIVQVDQVAVSNAASAEQALAIAKQQQRPSIVLVRRGKSQFFTTVNVA